MEDRLKIGITCLTFEKLNEIENRMIKSGELGVVQDLNFMIDKLCNVWMCQDDVKRGQHE